MRRLRVAGAFVVLALAWFFSLDSIGISRGRDPSSCDWISPLVICLVLAALGAWLARPLPAVPPIRELIDRPLAITTLFAVCGSWATMAAPRLAFGLVLLLFIVYSLGAPIRLIAYITAYGAIFLNMSVTDP